jgi:hypothetical protein
MSCNLVATSSELQPGRNWYEFFLIVYVFHSIFPFFFHATYLYVFVFCYLQMDSSHNKSCSLEYMMSENKPNDADAKNPNDMSDSTTDRFQGFNNNLCHKNPACNIQSIACIGNFIWFFCLLFVIVSSQFLTRSFFFEQLKTMVILIYLQKV